MLLAAALGGCAWFDSKQRELALRPTPTRPDEISDMRPGDLRFKVPVTSATADIQQLALWWLPHADPQCADAALSARHLSQSVPQPAQDRRLA